MNHKARSRAHQGSALMWFGVLGGGVAWSVHLVTSYLLAESACVDPRLQFELWGIAGTSLLLLATTLVTGLVALAAVLVGVGQWLTWRRQSEHQHAAHLSLLGLILSGTFLVIILVEGLPPFFLATCG